jgi:hypothetical protein
MLSLVSEKETISSGIIPCFHRFFTYEGPFESLVGESPRMP